MSTDTSLLTYSNEDTRKGSNELFWNFEFINKYLCAMCLSLLHLSVQTDCCGQRICKHCSDKLDHLKICPFCSYLGNLKTLPDKGFQLDLKKLKINCPRCQTWEGLFLNLTEHMESKHRDIKCEHCSQLFIFPQQLIKHQENDCQFRKISCPLAFLGCLTDIPEDEINDHHASYQHQEYILSFMKQYILKNSQKSIKNRCQAHFNEIKISVQLLLTQITDSFDNCTTIKDQQTNSRTKLTQICTQIEHFTESFNNASKIFQSYEHLLNSIENILREIKSKPMKIRTISSEGNYIFKLNIQHLNDIDQIIHSECIYTSENGYKMSIIYETFTDQSDKQRYLLIKYTTLKGEFDAILSWPMVFPLTFSLLNLTPKKNNITETIFPQSYLASFQKPKDNSNETISIQKFCNLNKIFEQQNTYIQDNFIYIQFTMDFTAALVIHDSISDKLSTQIHNNNIHATILSPTK